MRACESAALLWCYQRCCTDMLHEHGTSVALMLQNCCTVFEIGSIDVEFATDPWGRMWAGIFVTLWSGGSRYPVLWCKLMWRHPCLCIRERMSISLIVYS